MRPSILFGPEDDFFNRFAALARMSPALPLIGGGRTRFQPVFAGDVAAAIAEAVEARQPGRDLRTGRAGNPDIQGADAVRPRDNRAPTRSWCRCRSCARQVAGDVSAILPKPPLTPDQVELLRSATTSCRMPRSGRHGRSRASASRPINQGGRAVLSLAVPQNRPIPQTAGLALKQDTTRRGRRRPPECATRQKARSCGAGHSAGTSSPRSIRR